MGGPIESISVKCLSLDENERCRDGSEPIPNFSDLFRLQDHFNGAFKNNMFQRATYRNLTRSFVK